jgi:hypothetical protein
LIAAAALFALLSGTSRAGAGPPPAATATGKHVRTQLLKVPDRNLSGSGAAHGTLTSQRHPRRWRVRARLRGRTLWLHARMPR